MHARFRFQPAIGVRAGNLVGAGFDPGLGARFFRLQLDLVAAFLGPADIHPLQHRGPVAGLRATRARVDFEEGVIRIRLTIEQGFELFRRGGFFQRGKRGLGLGDDFLVVFHLAHLDQFDIVLQILLDPVIGLELVHQLLPVAHQFLRARLIVPQGGVFDHRVEFLDPVRRGLEVHPLAQQGQGLADLFDGVLRLGAHLSSS